MVSAEHDTIELFRILQVWPRNLRLGLQVKDVCVDAFGAPMMTPCNTFHTGAAKKPRWVRWGHPGCCLHQSGFETIAANRHVKFHPPKPDMLRAWVIDQHETDISHDQTQTVGRTSFAASLGIFWMACIRHLTQNQAQTATWKFMKIRKKGPNYITSKKRWSIGWNECFIASMLHNMFPVNLRHKMQPYATTYLDLWQHLDRAKRCGGQQPQVCLSHRTNVAIVAKSWGHMSIL